jgi:hypothetical protein
MPKPTPHRGPDPMAGVVDRLLAQLPGLQDYREAPRSTSVGPVVIPSMPGTAPRASAISQRQVLGMWVRVLLALSLGMMMGWWPYARVCGFPLFGYLGAVTTVIMAGSWAAAASWRIRSGLAHVISLILVMYGIILSGSEVLPRTGYAVDHATWQCKDAALVQSWTASIGS